MNAIRAAMSGAGRETPPAWDEVHDELFALASSDLDEEGERLLLCILAFGGELWLDESKPITHRMTPESMLKSLAAQYLGKQTGLKHERAMREALVGASPALRCMIEGVLKQYGG